MDLVRSDLNSTTEAAIAGTFYPNLLVKVDWPGGVIYAHMGEGNLSWDGHTWVGASKYGDVTLPSDSEGLVPETATIRLAVPEAEIDATMTADIRGRSVTIYSALMSSRAGNTLVGAPFELFSGYMDGQIETVQRTEQGTSTVVSVEIGSGPAMRTSARLVHSDETQRSEFPTDTIGRLLINSIERQKRIVW